MSAKVRLSYTDGRELTEVINLLGDTVTEVKIQNGFPGGKSRAYITLNLARSKKR